MNITHLRNKSAIAAVGAAVAAAALPAFLFTGPGNAQAATTLNTASDAVGVTVEIHSTGSQGLCFYTAEPWFGWTTVKPLPVYKVPFLLQADQSCGSRASRLAPHGKRKLNAPSAALTISIPITEDPHAFGGVLV